MALLKSQMTLLKSQMSFSKRQKNLKCLWSKNFELQKCGHTGKIKLWAKFVNHFDVFDNYGVGKSQCDCSTRLLCLSQFQLGTSPPGNPRGLAQKDCPGGWDLTFESCPGAGNSAKAGILWKLKVKHFVRLLVLLVINRGCPKNC